MNFAISDEYKWVCLVASLICFHLTLTGFWAGGKRKLFTKEFMDENFKTEHERAFPGTEPSKEGYPDVGSGRYANRLPYKDWYTFNNAQRAHYNYLESVTVAITWLLIGGLRYEWVAVGAGSVYLIGRIMYTVGYAAKGPKGRTIGFLIQLAANMCLFVLSILSPLKMAGVYTDSYKN